MKNEFVFRKSETSIFLTGVPLSGKSTIAPRVAAQIEGCETQSMDIFRLFANAFEDLKPDAEQNRFVRYGSCDSYLHIGDGKYTPDRLVEGFRRYALGVSSLLKIIYPSLEAQGARNLLFEGVQLTPEAVKDYLFGDNKLIIVRADIQRLRDNREKLYGRNQQMEERYSDESLLLIQDEILRQSRLLDPNTYFIVENTADYAKAVDEITQFLTKTEVIVRK